MNDTSTPFAALCLLNLIGYAVLGNDPPQVPEPPQVPVLTCLCSIGGPCRCEAIGRVCDCPGGAKAAAPKIVPATVRVRVESAPLLGPGWHRHHNGPSPYHWIERPAPTTTPAPFRVIPKALPIGADCAS